MVVSAGTEGQIFWRVRLSATAVGEWCVPHYPPAAVPTTKNTSATIRSSSSLLIEESSPVLVPACSHGRVASSLGPHPIYLDVSERHPLGPSRQRPSAPRTALPTRDRDPSKQHTRTDPDIRRVLDPFPTRIVLTRVLTLGSCDVTRRKVIRKNPWICSLDNPT
jgi:hypothetical protein